MLNNIEVAEHINAIPVVLGRLTGRTWSIGVEHGNDRGDIMINCLRGKQAWHTIGPYNLYDLLTSTAGLDDDVISTARKYNNGE